MADECSQRVVVVRVFTSWGLGRDAEFCEMNVGAGTVLGATVPDAAKIAGSDFDQRGIRVFDTGMIEGFFRTPRAP